MPLRLMGAVLETATAGRRCTSTAAASCSRSATSCRWPPPRSSRASCSPGCYARHGPTTVIEPVPTRDHTERMLRAAGAPSPRGRARVSVWPVERARAAAVDVPGRHLLGRAVPRPATLLAESRLFVRGCRHQPDAHRPADSARAHGRAHQALRPPHDRRRRADRRRRGAPGRARRDRDRARDRAVADRRAAPDRAGGHDGARPHRRAWRRRAARQGVEPARDGRELLRAIGGHVRATDDGWEIKGVPARPGGGRVDAHGDHRIGMLGAVAGLVSRNGVRVDGASAIGVSYPGFAAEVERLAVRPW